MTDEKLRLQKHPGYRIYSPVPASGVSAMIERYQAEGGMVELEDGFYVRASDYDALAARLAEAERLLREGRQYSSLSDEGQDELCDQIAAWEAATDDFLGVTDRATEPP